LSGGETSTPDCRTPGLQDSGTPFPFPFPFRKHLAHRTPNSICRWLDSTRRFCHLLDSLQYPGSRIRNSDPEAEPAEPAVDSWPDPFPSRHPTTRGCYVFAGHVTPPIFNPRKGVYGQTADCNLENLTATGSQKGGLRGGFGGAGHRRAGHKLRTNESSENVRLERRIRCTWRNYNVNWDFLYILIMVSYKKKHSLQLNIAWISISSSNPNVSFYLY